MHRTKFVLLIAISFALSSGWVSAQTCPDFTFSLPDFSQLDCNNNEVTITAILEPVNLDFNFFWLTDNGSFSSLNDQQTIRIDAPGDYTAWVWPGNRTDCKQAKTFTVTFNGPEYYLVPPEVITCNQPNTDIILQATANYSYQWTGPDNFTSLEKSLNGVQIPGIYTVMVSDPGSGCTADASVEVLIDTMTTSIDMEVSNDLGCALSTATVRVVPDNSMVNYTWTGPTPDLPQASTVEVNRPGNYVVVIEYANGCIGS